MKLPNHVLITHAGLLRQAPVPAPGPALLKQTRLTSESWVHSPLDRLLPRFTPGHIVSVASEPEQSAPDTKIGVRAVPRWSATSCAVMHAQSHTRPQV